MYSNLELRSTLWVWHDDCQSQLSYVVRTLDLDLMRSFKRMKVTWRGSCHNGDAELKLAMNERMNRPTYDCYSTYASLHREFLDLAIYQAFVRWLETITWQLATEHLASCSGAQADLTHLYPLPLVLDDSVKVTQEKCCSSPGS